MVDEAQSAHSLDRSATLRSLAKAAMREKRWMQAIELWQSLLEPCASGESKGVRLQLARAYRQMGRFEEAESQLTALIEADRESVRIDCVAEYARLAMSRRDWREALARWTAVLGAYRTEMPPGGYAQMARCHIWLGDPDAAERIISRGLMLHSNHRDILLEWCAVAIARGDLLEASRRADVAFHRLDVIPEALWELRNQVRLALEWRELLSEKDCLTPLSPKSDDALVVAPRIPPIVLVTHRPIDYYQSPCGSVYHLFVNPEHRIAEPLAHINVAAELDPASKLPAASGENFSLFFNGLASLTFPGAVPLLQEALRREMQVIVYWHETAWSIRGALRRHGAVLERVVPLLNAASSKHLVVTSQGTHSLVSLLGVPFESVRIVHEVVDLSRFRPKLKSAKPGCVQAVLGAGSESRSTRKGADTFSVIAHLVRSELDPPPEFHWYLSSDPTRPKPAVPYPEAVDWRGHCKPFERALADADCFILTSRDDPAARVVLEALASGIPVLAFASTGFVELLPKSMICSSYQGMARKLVRILQGEREAPEVYRAIAEQFSAQNWVDRAFGEQWSPVAPVPDVDLGILSRRNLTKHAKKLSPLTAGSSTVRYGHR